MPALLLISLLLILPPLMLLLLHSHISKDKCRLPPGPTPLPVIGSLHMLGKLPHRALAKLAQKYGPIMHLRFGLIPTIVVSSPPAAELFLKDFDHVFASRPPMQASIYMWYGGKAIGLTPYGDYWRKMKKMCTTQLLSPIKVQGFEWLRTREIEAAVQSMKVAAEVGKVVDVEKLVSEMVEAIVFEMVVGKGKKEDEVYDLKKVVQEALVLGGAFNLADFVPWLAPFDLQGLIRKMKVLSEKLDKTFERIMEEHLKEEDCGQHKDILGVMLTQMNKENDDEYSSFGRDNVKAMMLDLFSAGIDTTTLTVTWALAALVKQPRVMKAFHEELDAIIGRERTVKESDLRNLPYLDTVVKETFRLYPAGPLLQHR